MATVSIGLRSPLLAWALMAAVITACPARGYAMPEDCQVARDAPVSQRSAGPNETSEQFMVLALPARIEGIVFSSIPAQITADGTVRIDVETLITRAAGLFSEELTSQLRALASDDRFVRLDEINTPLVQMRFNASLSEIDITLVADARPVQVFEVLNEAAFDYATYRQSDSTTAFLNVFSSVLANDGGQRSSARLSSVLQGGVRIGGVNGIGVRGEAFVNTDTPDSIIRGEFFAFKDDVRRVRRYSAGDLFVDAGGLQGSVPFAGARVATLFSLQPRTFFRPTGRTSFLLDRPSTVRVIVDGNPIRTLRLQPGPVEITNLPFTDGANNVQFEVIDDSGIIQDINFSQFFDSQLLRQGLHQYSYQAGIFRGTRSRAITYFPEEWLVSGYHRYGLTDELTLGANLQASADVAQGGVEAVYASPIGNLGLQASFSQSSGGGIEPAGALSYTFFPNPSAGPGTSVQLSAEYIAEGFADISSPNAASDAELRFGTSVSRALTESTNLALGANWTKNRFSPDVTSLDLTLAQRIGPRFSALASVGYDEGSSRRSGLSVLFNITARLGPRESATARYSSVSEDFSAQYNRASRGRVGSFGGGALARANADRGRYDIDGDLNYVGNRFTASAGYLSAFDQRSTRFDNTVRVSAASSVVFADGRFGVSRPVRESFVMVEKHPSLAEATILLDRSEFGYLGKTDALGPAVIPDLVPYQNRILDFTVEGLPLGYDVGDASFQIVAPAIGSRRFLVGSEDSISIVGFAQMADGSSLSLVAGRIMNVDRSETDSQVFFTNQAGRFSAQRLSPGQYRIELYNGDVASFSIPADAGNFIRLEKPIVFEPARGADKDAEEADSEAVVDSSSVELIRLAPPQFAERPEGLMRAEPASASWFGKFKRLFGLASAPKADNSAAVSNLALTGQSMDAPCLCGVCPTTSSCRLHGNSRLQGNKTLPSIERACRPSLNVLRGRAANG